MPQEPVIVKLKILIFIPYFVPGFKGGGPTRSIVNLTEVLSDGFEFWLVTLDRDLGDTSAYSNLPEGTWIARPFGSIIYLNNSTISPSRLKNIVDEVKPDVIYTNSFFDKHFTIPLLIAKKIWGLPAPVIVAPRGEFSPGCLALKGFKKSLYIKAASTLGLSSQVYWHATNDTERKEIQTLFKIPDARVYVAQNLPGQPSVECSVSVATEGPKDLHVIFLARISREKNLLGAIKILMRVKSRITFDIYGPPEDLDYLSVCAAEARRLPSNVNAVFRGPVKPQDVSQAFRKYDVFLYPTLGENYGHVIAESLSVGTRVLTSNNTPWSDLKERGIGWAIDSDDEAQYAMVLDLIAQQSPEERLKYRHHTILEYQKIDGRADRARMHRAFFSEVAKNGQKISGEKKLSTRIQRIYGK